MAGTVALSRVRAVVFDVGETLVDETRIWSRWADRLGIPRLTLMAVLGATIAREAPHRDPFQLLRPDLDIRAEVRRLAEAGDPDDIRREDLYPDVEPALAALRAEGFRIGIAGNQPRRSEDAFRSLAGDVDLIASSEGWGIAKPDPRFFEQIAARLDLPPDQIAYVGDRVDNDVGPAAGAGMVAVFIRRGPWAWIQAGRTDPPDAALVIESLLALPAGLRADLRPGRLPSGG